MKNLKFLLAVAIVIITIASCSKEGTSPQPTPSDNGFVAKLVEQPRKGHYMYSLAIEKGAQFVEGEYTLTINMNGAKGSVLVNGNEYTIPVSIDPKSVQIAYLPFSAGKHSVGVTIRSGGQTSTANINFENVTALRINETLVTYGEQKVNLAVDAGDMVEMVESKYMTCYASKGDIYVNTLKTGSGAEYVYTRFNGVWTGIKVIVSEYVPLQFVIMEVNGIRIDQNTGVIEIEDIARKTNWVESNTIKIIDIYPKNATNSNPQFAIYANKDYDIINKTTLEVRKDITYEFYGTSDIADIPYIHITNEPNESGEMIIPLWKWKN